MKFSIADVNDVLVNTQVFIQSHTFSTSLVGCLDPAALNYDAQAIKDSGQCAYAAGAVLRFDAIDLGSVVHVCESEKIQWVGNGVQLGINTSSVEVSTQLVPFSILVCVIITSMKFFNEIS